MERARLAFSALRGEIEPGEFREKYLGYCDDLVRDYYNHRSLPNRTRLLDREELDALERYRSWEGISTAVREGLPRPAIFIQYGTGCPIMDIMHIKTCEAWGADGVVHFDPSWGARTEGLLAGYLAHSEDGTVITLENLRLLKEYLRLGTLWQVRAHRGLNTPETVVLAGEVGADLTKINMVYASLGAGMDPARMTVDGVEAIRWAVHYGLSFDVVTNEELCGVLFQGAAGISSLPTWPAKWGGGRFSSPSSAVPRR